MVDSRLSSEEATESERPKASERPIFYFDFASPECWLAGERVNHELPVVPVWVPVRVARAAARPSTDELADLDRRGAQQGLPAIRLPDPWPEDLDVALRAATFAAASGRVVAFSLAALRQAFAAGRDLSQVDNVLIAAAACELHPRAVLKGIESRIVEDRLREATAEARHHEVGRAPAIWSPAMVSAGSNAIDAAAAVLGGGRWPCDTSQVTTPIK